MKLRDWEISFAIVIAVTCSVVGSTYFGDDYKLFCICQQLEEEVGLMIIATLCRYLKFTVAAVMCEALLVLSFGKLYDIANDKGQMPMLGDYVFFWVACGYIMGRAAYITYKRKKKSLL